MGNNGRCDKKHHEMGKAVVDGRTIWDLVARASEGCSNQRRPIARTGNGWQLGKERWPAVGMLQWWLKGAIV